MSSDHIHVPFGSWEAYAQFLMAQNESEKMIKEGYLSFIISKGLYDEYQAYCRQKDVARSSLKKRLRSTLRKTLDDIYNL